MQYTQHPRTWYTTNLVGVGATVLASTEFNAYPVPLHIGGTREAHAGLFALLDNSTGPDEASEVFMHYLSLVFGLQPEVAPTSDAESRRWRASYIKLLQGWGLDSNGPAGAVLKGWVESRFGLVPIFHKAPLARFPSPVWVSYLEEKVSSRFHNNCIYQQLDLLYEYAQWAVRRFWPFEGDGSGTSFTHVCLWRGVTRCDEQVVAGQLRPAQGPRRLTVQLNNIVSLSTSAAQAECFGDWLWQVKVPVVKLLYYPGLLSHVPLSGEGEVLAIGGDYEVEARYV